MYRRQPEYRLPMRVGLLFLRASTVTVDVTVTGITMLPVQSPRMI